MTEFVQEQVQPIVSGLESLLDASPTENQEPEAGIHFASSALSADGDVALKPPLPLEATRDVVDALLRAHVDEDFERLRELSLPDASTHNPTVGRGSTISLHASFRERVRRLDYHKLEGLPLAVNAEMEVYTLDDNPSAPAGTARGPARHGAR